MRSTALEGVEKVWPSEANMVLLRVRDAGAAQAAMKQRGVLVKNARPCTRCWPIACG